MLRIFFVRQYILKYKFYSEYLPIFRKSLLLFLHIAVVENESLGLFKVLSIVLQD